MDDRMLWLIKEQTGQVFACSVYSEAQGNRSLSDTYLDLKMTRLPQASFIRSRIQCRLLVDLNHRCPRFKSFGSAAPFEGSISLRSGQV